MKTLYLIPALAATLVTLPCCKDKDQTADWSKAPKAAPAKAEVPTRSEWLAFSAVRHRAESLKVLIPIYERGMTDSLSPENKVRSERSLHAAMSEQPEVELALEAAWKQINAKLSKEQRRKLIEENAMEMEYRELEDILSAAPATPDNEAEARAKLQAEDDLKASDKALVTIRRDLSLFLLGRGSPRELMQEAYEAARKAGVLAAEEE